MNTTLMGISGTIGLICMIWVLYEVWAVGKHLGTGQKVIWSLAAVFFSFFTAIAYYVMEKRNVISS